MSQTLERALTILDFLGERPRRITEIATFLEVHHSTALRLLHSLRKYGFVQELPDHRYRLGAALFRLGFQALDSIDIRNVARPFMQTLNELTGETVHLGTLESGTVVYVEKVESRHGVRTHSRIGAVASMHSSGVAKAIVAFLPPADREALVGQVEMVRRTPNSLTSVAELEADLAATRSRGYAIDNEENEPGIHCIAAPVFGGGGQLAGSISLTAPISRIDRDTLISYLPGLLEATQGTSRQLGWAS